MKTGIYTGLFIFIAFIAWLSSGEIRRSLTRARSSEKSLVNERDILEQRVSERTGELIASEKARGEERERVTRFGELSQGLFHDLMSPLSLVSLYIERLANQTGNTKEAREVVTKAVEASRRMRSFMDSVKSVLGNRETVPTQASALVSKELSLVRDLLGYKARLAGVRLVTEGRDTITLPIHSVRLQQLLLNLVSNGIEACEHYSSKRRGLEKIVRVSVQPIPSTIVIRVSDNGRGMTTEERSKVFHQPFSSKPNGSGIGLMTVKSIVEDELKGTITMESKENIGTTFEIVIPYKP